MSAETLSFEFQTSDVVIQGKTIKLRELTAEKYDECVKAATGPDDEIDMVTLLRLMLFASIVEPKIDTESFAQFPYSVQRRLTTAVNRLHFSDPDASGNA